jgi:hypothetical protein
MTSLLELARLCAHQREMIEAFSPLPNIKVISTDAAYWARKKGWPELIEQRQVQNARHAGSLVRATYPEIE